MELTELAKKCREYAETEQNREFRLEGACHENALGCAEYVQYNTDLTPIIVWGYVDRDPEQESLEKIQDTEEEGLTHFWVKIKEKGIIIDIHPIGRGWSDSSISRNTPYAGSVPREYHSVKEFYYEGWMTSADLASQTNFDLVSTRIEEYNS